MGGSHSNHGAHTHAHHHAGHAHGGAHTHLLASFTRAFAIGIALNLVFVAVEAGYGYAAGSLALMADAGHNLSDVLGLALAWGASVLSARKPSLRYTYGLRSSSILAAVANASALLIAVGAIAIEAIQRLASHSGGQVAATTVMAVAGVGIIINGVTALLFMSGRHGDLNVRGAFLHMVGDAVISAGVLCSGYLVLRTGLTWIDPATSLVVAAFILISTWSLLKDSLNLALAAVPSAIDTASVRQHLLAQTGVTAVHDLHIWAMSTTETALTAHLVTPAGHPGDEFIHSLCTVLRSRFGIQHTTVQIELGSASCALESEEVV